MELVAFRTADGVPVTAVTANEMRAVDDAATHELGLSLLQMMENAGRALVEYVLEQTDGPVVVVAGSGGNGGGGLVSARHLWNHDRDVTVHLDRPPASLSGATAHQFGILDTLDVPTSVGDDEPFDPDAGVVVDALIGYGFSGPARGTAKNLIRTINHGDVTVISLDVPSGLDATNGEAGGRVMDSELAFTFALPKTGLAAIDCPLSLVDISIPRWVYAQLNIPYETPFDTRYIVPLDTNTA